MGEERAKRKLAAIFSADVKGYSRLMADDEEATVRTINAYRKVIKDQIQAHNGRVVDAKGDNVLAEFPSVVDAVRCSAEVQKELKGRNDELPEHRKMEFRIGVNLGDVIEEEETIYGDGVNVAARLEGLADAGGICISGTAYDQVKRKLTLGYEYLGEQTIKNIPELVRAYKVLMEPKYAGKVLGKESPKPKRWRWVAVAIAIIVLAGTWVIWNFYFQEPSMEVASVDRMAYPLPDKPSIAVLPFDNLSGDPKQEYFSDGLTEEIITALSRIPHLFVIARNSTFTYKGKPVKIKQVAEEFGVRYVLDGTVRKSEDRVRITAQLIDALTGRHMWAERYDRNLKDIFAIQDEITMKIITALQVKLKGGDSERLYAKGTDNLDAYLKSLQSRELSFGAVTKEKIVLARRLAEEAISLDPKYPEAYRVLAHICPIEVWLGMSKAPRETLKRGVELAQKVIHLDNSNAHAYSLLGIIYVMQRQHDKGVASAERAYALEPNSFEVLTSYAWVLYYVGKWEEAARLYEEAMRINPVPDNASLRFYGATLRELERYDEAIAVFKKAIKQDTRNPFAHLMLAVTYSLAGREEEARETAKEVIKINPKISIRHLEKTAPFKNPAHLKTIFTAMRKVGLPETPPLSLPDKPSIAVLPFTNMSGDPKQEYFSDGISTEIINALVRWPAIVVIPKSSSFIYKGKTVDVKQVGREMGVKYVLEGTVRREENKVRVSVQLIDATTREHIFSERYEREMKHIFAVQDDITMRVLTAMRVSLSGEGVQPLRGKGTKSIDAYLKILQAETVMQAVNRDTQAQARLLAEEGIALDPEYARAYTMKAVAIGNEVLLGVYEDPQEALKRAMIIAEKAVQLDDSEETAHRGLGFLALLNKDYEKAIAGGKRAVELAPNSVMAQIILGYFLYSAGRTEEAIPILEKAASSSPIILPRALSHLGVALRKAGRLEEAVAVCTKLIQIKPNYIFPHLTLAAAFAEMGKMEEARAEVKEVLRIRPKYNVKLVPSSFPWKDQDELDRLADFLRKAGLPE